MEVPKEAVGRDLGDAVEDLKGAADSTGRRSTSGTERGLAPQQSEEPPDL